MIILHSGWKLAHVSGLISVSSSFKNVSCSAEAVAMLVLFYIENNTTSLYLLISIVLELGAEVKVPVKKVAQKMLSS